MSNAEAIESDVTYIKPRHLGASRVAYDLYWTAKGILDQAPGDCSCGVVVSNHAEGAKLMTEVEARLVEIIDQHSSLYDIELIDVATTRVKHGKWAVIARLSRPPRP